MINSDKWKNRYLALAYHVSHWSKDPSTKVGAVIVNDKGEIKATGYNGFPRGVKDSEHRLSKREKKLCFVVHAETNAIIQAGHDARDTTLFCTHFPCNECAKLIVQAGIKKVVAAGVVPGWDNSESITRTMFKEAGVEWEVAP